MKTTFLNVPNISTKNLNSGNKFLNKISKNPKIFKEFQKIQKTSKIFKNLKLFQESLTVVSVYTAQE